MLLSVVAPVVLGVPAVLAEAVAAAVALKLHDVGQGGSSTELDQEQPLSDELDPDMKITNNITMHKSVKVIITNLLGITAYFSS